MRLRFPTLVLLCSTALFAACIEGESNPRYCPDEVCPDQTPNGLHFVGPRLHDLSFLEGPFVTAIGGTQVVDVMLEDRVNELAPLADTLPFAVSFSNGNALTVQRGDANGSTILVTGVASGNDYLRISEPNNGLLMDGVQLDAMRAIGFVVADPGHGLRSDGAPLAFLSGQIRFAINLMSERGDRLVDQGLTVTVDGTPATMLSFDVAEDVIAQPGNATISVATGGDSLASSILVVAGIDSIAAESDSFGEVISVLDTGRVCFVAKTGTAVVAGLDWTFEVRGTAFQSPSTSTCVELTFYQEGTATVTATAGGSSVTTTLTTGATLQPRSGAGKATLPANF